PEITRHRDRERGVRLHKARNDRDLTGMTDTGRQEIGFIAGSIERAPSFSRWRPASWRLLILTLPRPATAVADD
ncbi:MAG TPA: hypothetical protein VKC16_07870, partial [Xanthobacteraceae bacterium]|nr:hypothetical protein [Xanthobacteraceae bacterium]